MSLSLKNNIELPCLTALLRVRWVVSSLSFFWALILVKFSLSNYICFNSLEMGNQEMVGQEKHTVGPKMEYLRNAGSVVHLPGTSG